MSKVLELELRIENIIVSWLRNSIILITLATALKSFGGDKMIMISNLLILLSIFVIFYIYKKINKLKSHFKNVEVNNLYLIIYVLFIITILVLFRL